jgi:predicted metal-dependent hydrolase
MAFKEFDLDEHIKAKVYKRQGARSIRLSIQSSGAVRVSIPTWTPYRAGIEFAKSKINWIKSQQKPRQLLIPNQQIGKAHRLIYLPSKATKITSRLVSNNVYIKHPFDIDWQSATVQLVAEQASIRALRHQAENLLPQRLESLAKQHGFIYTSLKIKRLKSRWGSCDSKQNIVLNLFLMQLPWECIDYVLLHELAHTQHMNHGTEFWHEVMAMVPDVKDIRKKLRGYQPLLNSVPHQAM